MRAEHQACSLSTHNPISFLVVSAMGRFANLSATQRVLDMIWCYSAYRKAATIRIDAHLWQELRAVGTIGKALLESAKLCSWISGSAPLMAYNAQHRLRRSRLG